MRRLAAICWPCTRSEDLGGLKKWRPPFFTFARRMRGSLPVSRCLSMAGPRPEAERERRTTDMPTEESKPQVPDRPANAEAAKPATGPARKRRRWVLPLMVLLAIIALFVGIPKVVHALNTVSTDDAYVNSYVTFVAPRVAG